MAMLSRLMSSLQFRLLASFVFVLSLALVGVSFYTGQVADREASKLRRDVDEVRADIVALEKETEGLLSEIIGEETSH